jgi:hypothetical protein
MKYSEQFTTIIITPNKVSYRVNHKRGISEFLFAATHYTHCNNILISNFENIITESTTALSPVSLTLKQKIFVNSKKLFLQ